MDITSARKLTTKEEQAEMGRKRLSSKTAKDGIWNVTATAMCSVLQNYFEINNNNFT